MKILGLSLSFLALATPAVEGGVVSLSNETFTEVRAGRNAILKFHVSATGMSNHLFEWQLF